MERVILVLSVFSFSFISLSSSSRHKLEACPSISAKSELNVTKLSGFWMVYGKYGYNAHEDFPLCTWFTFTIGQDGKKISLVQKDIYTSYEKEREFSLTPNGDGMFTKHVEDNTRNRTFTILDTDYECWAVVYECKQKNEDSHTSAELRSVLLVSNTCLGRPYREKYENILSTKIGSLLVRIHYMNASACKSP